MAITYPLTWVGIQARKLTLRTRDVIGLETMPLTGEQQIQEHAGKWWEFEAIFPPLNEADGETLVCWRASLNGVKGTFLVGDLSKTRRGTPTGGAVVNGASQVGATLNIRNLTPNSTGNLLLGDYIQLGAGLNARLHKVLTASVDADGSGNASIDLWPNITAKQALLDGQAVIVDNPVGLFRQPDNANEWDVALAKQYGLVLAARSVV